jgi:hypothetical protein
VAAEAALPPGFAVFAPGMQYWAGSWRPQIRPGTLFTIPSRCL